MAKPGNTASTFLTHLFGRRLADDSYVVERFKETVDVGIRPCGRGGAAVERGRRKSRRVTATREAMREMRPTP